MQPAISGLFGYVHDDVIARQNVTGRSHPDHFIGKHQHHSQENSV